jgi:sugar/nucleoside kinase (ribokinase family)
MDSEVLFKVPAYPLEEVFDPTGAGDAFAGGFMGHVARTGDLSPANLRLAMVYGAAMGSFAVEEFGIRRFDEVDLAEVEARVRGFRDLVHFDHGGAST